MQYLVSHGYKILERNYHNRTGELDIIARKESTLVAVEVKFRSTDRYGDPLEAVDIRKQRRIRSTMLYYCTTHGYGMDVPCRFDVIGIYGDGTVKHIENAFGGLA